MEITLNKICNFEIKYVQFLYCYMKAIFFSFYFNK